jgi:hypothetical protein
MDVRDESKGGSNGAYGGAERRRHRVYVTRNTEYHFRDGVCVGVRDRRSEEWLPGHLALRRQLFGSIRFLDNGGMLPTIGDPRLGDALFFGTGGRDIVTSALVSIERPAKSIVADYPL